MNKPEPDKKYQTDPPTMTKKVKDTAKLYGASLVGVTVIHFGQKTVVIVQLASQFARILREIS